MKKSKASKLLLAGLFFLTAADVGVAAVATNGWPNDIIDAYDYPCQHNQDGLDGATDCGSCGGASGMVRWRVSEPYTTLWLHDEPFGYEPSQGPAVALQLTYKHRSVAVDLGFSSFGKNWSCPWFGYVDDDGVSVSYNSTGAKFPLPLLTIPSYKVGVAVYQFVTDNGSGPVVHGYYIYHEDGSSEEYLEKRSDHPLQPTHYLLRYHYDPFGYKTEFRYDLFVGRVVRQIIDGDGKTNFLSYNHTITNLVTSIQDPYGRIAQFQYDAAGNLTNIIDVATNSSALAYDATGLITNLTTPYGSTAFKVAQSSPFQDPNNTNRWVALGGTNLINRSIEITEPNGSKQLYLYRDEARKLSAGSGVDLVPASFPLPATGSFSNTFEDSDLFYRNSFHWGRRQYAAISTAGKADYSNLTTNDYQLARMKHWLSGTSTNGEVVSDTLSMVRESSPDGITAGPMTWKDYSGQGDSHHEGDDAEPRFIARLLPDGASSFTRYAYDEKRNPTNIISTYSVGATVCQRTNELKYSGSFKEFLTELSVREGASSSVLMRAWYSTTSRRMLYFTNAVGEITTNKYENVVTMARLTNVFRPSGLSTKITYLSGTDGDGWVDQIVDYTGTFTNGAAGNRVRSFTYTNGLVHTYTDPRGLTVTHTWDALQRLTSLSFPDGTYFSNRYDKLDLIASKDRLGHWRYFSHNTMRQLTAATDELGRTHVFGYCDCGAFESITDPLGHATFFDHDYAGRLTAITTTNATLAVYQYNGLGQITNALDGAGNSTRFTYNNQGLLTTISNAYGQVLAATYDHRDRPTNVITAAGISVANVFDNMDRLLSRSYPDGGVERFAYSARGLTTYTNQLNQRTLYGRDAFLRLASVTNANLELTQFSYNPAGDLLSLIDGNGHATSWDYNLFGQPLAKTNAAGVVVFTNGYDANWQLTAHWTPAKGLTSYGYDDAGNLTGIDYPTLPDVTRTYDTLNRLTSLITAGQFTNGFSYTNFGAGMSALASEDGPWDNDTLSYGYANLQRASMSLNSALYVSYAYDAARRLTNVTSPAGFFFYLPGALNPASALIQKLSLPGGSFITNTFDNMGRLESTTLKNSGGVIRNFHAYTYDLAGQRATQTRTAGDYLEYGYDGIGQLTKTWGHEPNVSFRAHEILGYGYDAAGNLHSRSNLSLVQTFNTDNLNQLSTLTRSGTFAVSGNTSITATNVTVNGLTAYRYEDTTFAKDNFTLTNGINSYTIVAKTALGLNATNTITVNLPATNTFAYDLNGNLRTNGPIIYEYDDENRLATNWIAAEWKSEHVYDGFSRRRLTRDYGWNGSAWIKTNETRCIHDGMLVLQERDSNNVPLVTYTRGLDLSGSLQGAGGIGGLLARTDNKGSTFYHSDGGGNVTAMVDVQGGLAARYLYDPFGGMLGMWGPVAERNHYRFSSKEQLHDGPYDFGFRFYEPNLQRWLNQDPIGEAGGINLYGFVGNSSLNFIDPFGLDYGDWALDKWDRFREFFLGKPGDMKVPDEGLRAGSGIQPLRDQDGNNITEDAIVEVALAPLMAVLGGPERTGATIFGDAVKCKKLSKVAGESVRVAQDVKHAATAVDGRSLWAASTASRGFKSFEELKKFLGSPGEGNQWHHIVEQNAFNIKKFGTKAIHNVDNAVPISAELNSKLNAFYQTKNPLTGGLPPREWLQGKTLQQNYDFGRVALDYVSRGIW